MSGGPPKGQSYLSRYRIDICQSNQHVYYMKSCSTIFQIALPTNMNKKRFTGVQESHIYLMMQVSMLSANFLLILAAFLYTAS